MNLLVKEKQAPMEAMTKIWKSVKSIALTIIFSPLPYCGGSLFVTYFANTEQIMAGLLELSGH